MLERHGQIVQVPIKPGGMSTPGGKSRPGSAFSTPAGKNGQQMQLTPAQQAIMAAQRNTVLSQQQSGKGGALPVTPQRGVPPQGLNMQVYPQGMASRKLPIIYAAKSTRLNVCNFRSSRTSSAQKLLRQTRRCSCKCSVGRQRSVPCFEVCSHMPKMLRSQRPSPEGGSNGYP